MSRFYVTFVTDICSKFILVHEVSCTHNTYFISKKCFSLAWASSLCKSSLLAWARVITLRFQSFLKRSGSRRPAFHIVKRGRVWLLRFLINYSNSYSSTSYVPMVIILAGWQDNVLEVYEVQICDFHSQGVYESIWVYV